MLPRKTLQLFLLVHYIMPRHELKFTATYFGGGGLSLVLTVLACQPLLHCQIKTSMVHCQFSTTKFISKGSISNTHTLTLGSHA